MKKSIKQTGLLYKGNPVKKLQQGGLTMGYGYRDPNKDMYRNIGDSSLYKESIKPASFASNTDYTNKRTARKEGGYGRTFDPNNIKSNTVTPVQEAIPKVDVTNTIKNPKNLSMGNGLMYTKSGYNVDNGAPGLKTPDIAADNPPDFVPKETDNSQSAASGASSIAGAANAVGQPALALLNDKDPYTYTDKEKVGTTASSTLATAATGAALGSTLGSLGIMVGTAAAIGTTVPVIGTVIGAVVGLGLGIWKMSKEKKKAEKNVVKRDRTIDINETANKKKRLAERDANVASSAGTTFGPLRGRSNKQEGVPGGYLSRSR